jgi:thiamine pyrophosphokinase
LKTLVVAHGDVAPSDREQLSGADMVIAADGGALALEGWGVRPNVVVGDFDSLGLERANAYRDGGATDARYPVAKDQSDLEIAMRFALETGAEDIVLLGILGGERLDHALVNAMLLADPAYRGRGVRAVFGGTMPAATLYARREFIDNNPHTVQALTNAIVRALLWLPHHSTEEVLQVVPEEYLMGNRAVYAASFERLRDTYSKDGRIPKKGVENAYQVLLAHNSAVRRAPVVWINQTYTNAFVEKALARYR